VYQRSIPFGYLLQLLVQVHRGSCLFFWSLLSFYLRFWWTKRLYIRTLHSWRSWSRRQRVKRYHKGQCKDTFGGLFWRNSRLWTTFLNCQSLRISTVSASRSKDVYCNWTSSQNVNRNNFSCWYKILISWISNMKFTLPYAPIRNRLPTASDRAPLCPITTA
jgi:hypothetical protein